MKPFFKWIGILLLLYGCSSPPADQPDVAKPLTVRMSVTGFFAFEDYIQSLTVFAFKEAENGVFLYYKTVAKLDDKEIAALKSTPGNNSETIGVKWLELSLPSGTYKLCFLANIPDDEMGAPEIGATTPADILLRNPGVQLIQEYFSATENIHVGSAGNSSLEVELTRMISRVLVRINDIPVVIDSLQIVLNELASALDITGKPNGAMESVTHSYALTFGNNLPSTNQVYQFLSFPAYSEEISMVLRFHSKSGEWKEKDITGLLLPPDRYLMVTGNISSTSGGLLKFNIVLEISVNNDWSNWQEPDFPIIPSL